MHKYIPNVLSEAMTQTLFVAGVLVNCSVTHKLASVSQR